MDALETLSAQFGQFPMRALFGFLSVPVVFLLGLYCLGIAILGWIDGGDMYLPLLPVAPENAATALGIAGLAGIAASLFALKRGFGARLLLLVWSVGLTLVLLAAVFRAGYKFEGLEGLANHAYLSVGSLILSVCAWLRLRTRPDPGLARH